ncbi:hypothetical protein ACIQF8_11655 [Pseudarthrobacter sp. NPDC092184]|uniref:biotin synthase auxiliary protein BsaP n=1 Tax=unclassified Pseudarthrobacter TaxID=2647000 RepID=UPI00382B7159
MIPNHPISPTTGGFCSHCGKAHLQETSDGGIAPPSDVPAQGAAHHECAARLQLEPPRYCRRCGRRVKVQVSPHAWSATCSRHGTTTS